MPLRGHAAIWTFRQNDAANLGETLPPALSGVEVGNVADNKIVLTYNENLDAGSVPATGDFSISGISLSISLVAVAGATVTLTINDSIPDDYTILVSYTAGVNPIRDLFLNEAANLVNQAVTNNSSISTPVELSIAYVATQFVFKWKAPSGSSLVFHEGDGTTQTVSGNDAALVTTTLSHAGAGTFDFWITGDVTDLTYIDINSQAFVSGDVSRWSELTNLTILYCYTTGISGNVSSWSTLVNLTQLYCQNTSIEGDISGWAALTSIVIIQGYLTSLSGDASKLSTLTSATVVRFDQSSVTFDTTAAWSMTGTIRFENCGWTSQMVDNSLAAFAGTPVTGCTINVAGTNAHRTAASNDDLNTLLANGNTITLNDTLGAELHTSLNAANDSATQAVTAFSDYAATIDGATKVDSAIDFLSMIPQGAIQNVNNCVNSNYTSFANGTPTGFDATSDGSGTHLAATEDEISFEKGKKYLVKFDLVLNSGTAPLFSIMTHVAGALVADEGFKLAVNGSNLYIFRANRTTTGVVRYHNGSAATDFEVTNLSIKELEVLGSDLVTNGDFTSGADLNVSDCVNSSYDAFSGAAPDAFNAAHTTSGTKIAGTADEISFVNGQKYTVSFDMVLNSGQEPHYNLHQNLAGTVVTDDGYQEANAGANSFEFTANQSTIGVVQFYSTQNANFEITNLSVRDSDTAWTKGNGWSIAGGVASYVNQGSLSALKQDIGLEAGGYYLLKFTSANVSVGELAITTSNATVILTIGSTWNVYADGTHTVMLYAPSTNNNLIEFFARQSLGDDFDIDNVSVHKLTFQKEIAASTNYTGTHYVLPIDENDFCIPVDYVAEAIVAQKFGGETNATTGWTPNAGLTAGANVFESQGVIKNVGSYALHANCNDTPTAFADFDKTFTVETSAVYRLAFDWRHIGTGGAWGVNINSGVAAYQINSTNITFDSVVYYFTAPDTDTYVRFIETSGANNGGIYMDNLSMKKVTLS